MKNFYRNITLPNDDYFIVYHCYTPTISNFLLLFSLSLDHTHTNKRNFKIYLLKQFTNKIEIYQMIIFHGTRNHFSCIFEFLSPFSLPLGRFPRNTSNKNCVCSFNVLAHNILKNLGTRNASPILHLLLSKTIIIIFSFLLQSPPSHTIWHLSSYTTTKESTTSLFHHHLSIPWLQRHHHHLRPTHHHHLPPLSLSPYPSILTWEPFLELKR